MNLICIFCGKAMHREVVDKKVSIEGFSSIDVPNLVIYKCTRCGKSVLPEASKKKLNKIKEELFSANGDSSVV
jgi:YgiT-type zinc finger domain-containing protein